MTTRLLIPVRIPELGPSLGKVVVGSGRHPGGLELASIRLRLATRVFDLVGEARRLAERDDRAAALETVGRTAWLEAWEEAVSSATDLMVGRANERIRLAAESVKMPARNRDKMMVTERERRMLHARMGSSAAPMVKTLNQLESLGQRAAVGKSGDGMRVWQDALRTSARRLEGAFDSK